MKVYYSHFVLSREIVLPSPNLADIDHHGNDESEVLRAVHQSMAKRVVDEKIRINALPLPASLIRSLLLNCQYGYRAGFDSDSRECQLWNSSLDMLRPHLTRLTELDHYSTLHNDTWDLVLQLNNLSSLSIRAMNFLAMKRLSFGEY